MRGEHCACGLTAEKVRERSVGTAFLDFHFERCMRCDKRTLCGGMCSEKRTMIANPVDREDEV